MANMEYSLRPQNKGQHTIEVPVGQYGVPDVMLHGLQSHSKVERNVHPLEHSEKHWLENKKMMDFQMLRKTEGIHAPLRLQMEFQTAKRMGRLPCLPSSNLMLDRLEGRDEMIDFQDIFNSRFEAETIGQPHLLMEKREGML